MTLMDYVTRFFELKKVGQCPECNAGIQFATDKRTLTAKCGPECVTPMEKFRFTKQLNIVKM
jgi:hypothetical protein